MSGYFCVIVREISRERVREAGLEPARPKTQVPKTCVSAISPLPQERRALNQDREAKVKGKRVICQNQG